MYIQVFAFTILALLFLNLSRLGLVVWQWLRVKQHAVLPIFLGGLRIDLSLLAMLVAPSFLLASVFDGNAVAWTINGLWLTLMWFLVVIPELSSAQFIYEYDTRPNRLFTDYLKHPNEVFGMLWKGYRSTLIVGVIVMLASSYGIYYVLSSLGRELFDAAWLLDGLFCLGGALVLFGLIRGTLKHRPINPSTVAYCGDGMLNTLPLNSLYSVLYALYSIKNERCAADAYGKMDHATVYALVNQAAGIEPVTNPLHIPSWHHQSAAANRSSFSGDARTASAVDSTSTLSSTIAPSSTGTAGSAHTATHFSNLSASSVSTQDIARTQDVAKISKRPYKNIVLIVQESLGAQYIGGLGGQDLSPEFDKLMNQGWCFERCYATGTRSVRGLEAVSSGFPPTISDAVLRLSKSQSRFFTLAQLLKDFDYRTSFIYGGEAHFDNMKSFFLGNGFSQLIEQPDFKDPAFVGTWGASDEDMFATLHDVLSQDVDVPKLSLAFTVTNHTPWEYPEGRIMPVGEPASVENSVRYVDWCMGEFFKKAQQSDYWDDTIFLVVADHDSRVWGETLVPLRHFHIPALILGGSVPVCRDPRVISQIDLPVTVLSLAGIEAEHPMIGRDLTSDLALIETGQVSGVDREETEPMRQETSQVAAQTTSQTPTQARAHVVAQSAQNGRAMMQYNDNYGYLVDDILTVLCSLKPAQQFIYQAPETYTPIPEANQRLDLIGLAQAHAIWPNLMYNAGLYTMGSLHHAS